MALITYPEKRLKELEGIENFIKETIGCRIESIKPPGILDGGDVLEVDSTIYVGLGTRTNEEGLRQLAEVFGPLGANVVGVQLGKVLHLKTAITTLPGGRFIG